MMAAEKFHIGLRGERISEEDRRTKKTSKRKRTRKHMRRKQYKAVVNEEGDVWAKKIKTVEF